MSLYMKRGNTYRIANEQNLNLQDKLPAATYVVKYDDFNRQFFLEQIEDFIIDFKLYGTTEKHSKRIINTFLDRTSATGVMLAGEKGSGKTLLAKKLSIDAREAEIPTLIINTPYTGESFNTFIQSLDFPAIIFFDEFEKIYSEKESQEAILTLFDGTFPSKKLFILTVNDKFKVDVNMRNRPGRIYYMIDFVGLDIDFIREYCEDNLIHKHHMESILRLSSVFCRFNFDMMKAVVEEINRYNEPAKEVMSLLNAKPEFDTPDNFDVTWTPGGELLTKKNPVLDTKLYYGSPLTVHKFNIEYFYTRNPDAPLEEQDEKYEYFMVSSKDLVKLDTQTGTFVYESAKYGKVTLTKKQIVSHVYANLI